jgi:hypothetical protein
MIYGSWTTIGPEGKTAARVLCRCVCGIEKNVILNNLRGGQSKSCGCISAVRNPGREKIEYMGESMYLMEWCEKLDLSYATVSGRFQCGASIERAFRPITEKRMAMLKCTGCKERFPRESMSRLPVGNFHSASCAILYAVQKKETARARHIAKQNKLAKTEKKKTSKAVRELDRKDVRWQHKLTQPVFNRMRVLEELKFFSGKGIEPTCVSCQQPLGGDQWCCGHLKSQGGNPKLRYDPKNTFLQHNHRCNMHLSGDIENYRHGIINGPRFKTMAGIAILLHCDTNTGPYKWEWKEVEDMRKVFADRCKVLQEEMSLL